MANKRYGALALIVGTFSVTALAILIAVPFSLGATVFLSEFCGGKVKESLKIVIELLAAIPSIVWGLSASRWSIRSSFRSSMSPWV